MERRHDSHGCSVVARSQGESGSTPKQDEDVDFEDLSAIRLMGRIRHQWRG
jgi:hypothetical protein